MAETSAGLRVVGNMLITPSGEVFSQKRETPKTAVEMEARKNAEALFQSTKDQPSRMEYMREFVKLRFETG